MHAKMHEYLCYQSGQMPDEFDYNKDTSKYFIVLLVQTISFDKIVKTKLLHYYKDVVCLFTNLLEKNGL